MTACTIYHNPRCSKSRAALALPRGNGLDPEVILYRDAEPTKTDLRCLSMMRHKAKLYRDLCLDADTVSNSERLEALARHPELLERPIVVRGHRAVIGRPPERIPDLIRNA